jgi:sporulation protein YhbH
MNPLYQDWSLQRKGPMDQARHLQKIRQALKERLGDLVTEESIVTSQGNRTVKVPIRSLEEYKFRYDPWRGDHVGQGSGDSGAGDVLGRLPKPANKPGEGGKEAGDQPGQDVYEVEISVDDLAALLFEDLGLPHLKPKSASTWPRPTERFRDVSKVGLMGNLDKRRTLRENLLRNARQGRAVVRDLTPDDLRFKTWVEESQEDTGAVIIAMRDVSGSMGDFKKFIARSFYFWMVRFLRTRYREVEVCFVVHHTQAREVDEDTFFRLGESGGTKVSSAYELCLDLIRRRYPPHRWNIYPFHFSDGDNWSDADNRRTVELLQEILPLVNVFGYGEIREGGYTSTLMTAFKKIDHPRFETLTITSKGEVLTALRQFFRRTPEVNARG